MAVSDEDWQKFIKATEEDPDEVETDEEDETEESEEDDPKTKPKKSEEDEDDPKPTDPTKKGKPAEEDEEDDPEGDEEDPDDPPKSTVKQFLNDKGEFDLKTAEKAYIESSKEGVRLNGELEKATEGYTKLLDALAANPKAAEALFGKEGSKKFLESRGKSGGAGGDAGAGAGSDALDSHPVIQHMQAKMDNDSRKEYDDFVSAHPEAVTDPEKRRLIGEFLKLHGQVYRAQHKGEIPNMKDALEAAYRYHGWELGTTSKKEDLAIAAKKAAATRSSGNAKKGAKSKEVTQGEQFFAQKLGVKLK